MKLILFITFATLFIFDNAQGATMFEVKLRIPQEEQFYNSEMSRVKTEMASTISSKQSTLNFMADSIKAPMLLDGPEYCRRFSELIDSVKSSMINFLYAFQSCETRSELGNFKLTMFELKKNAERVEAFCKFQPSTCQSNVDGLSRSLDVLHNSIVNDSDKRLRLNKECVENKGRTIEGRLNSIRDSWQKCN